jgi:feruloyl esterase
MAHGTPLAAGVGEGQSGVAGPFLLDVGVSSTHHIAKFFGLAPQAAVAREAGPAWPPTGVIEFAPKADEAPRPRAEHGPQANRHGSRKPGALPIDVNAVITKALKAAGLIRS